MFQFGEKFPEADTYELERAFLKPRPRSVWRGITPKEIQVLEAEAQA